MLAELQRAKRDETEYKSQVEEGRGDQGTEEFRLAGRGKVVEKDVGKQTLRSFIFLAIISSP